jgi:hypothetical protein
MDESQHEWQKPLDDGENPFRDNPYSSPETPGGLDPAFAGGPAPQASSRGMVGHVPAVAILMIVQGALETLLGAMLVVMGAVFPTLMNIQTAQGNPPPPGMQAQEMGWIMLAMYGGMGLVNITAGVLHITAGYRNYSFRSRTLGIVALVAGMATFITCYCAPTAIALGVYGLVTYMNSEVMRAFAMRAAGTTKEKIQAVYR